MGHTEVPECLRHAREEVIMSLSASDVKEAARHRHLAEDYFRQALKDLRREPDQTYDWELLRHS